MKKQLIIPLIISILLMIGGVCLENKLGVVLFVLGGIMLAVIDLINRPMMRD